MAGHSPVKRAQVQVRLLPLELTGCNLRTSMRTVAEWKQVLRDALREAQRTRQQHAVTVIRETLAAIDNAEAADTSAAPPVQHGVIAGSVPGLGAGEVPRRVLSPETVIGIIQKEIEERRTAAATYSAHGQHEAAETLKLQLELLTSLVGT